jgi:hypothetical protein
MFLRDNIDVNVIEMTPIVHVKGAIDDVTRKEIIDAILKIKKNKVTSPDTSLNCWRDSWRVDDNDDENAVSSKLGNKVLEILQGGLAEFQGTFISPTNFYIDSKSQFFDPNGLSVDAWINVNGKGGANIYHTHCGGIMSGVLYLQSYGTGEIVLKSERTVLNTYHPMWPYYGSAKYQPDDGDLLLFPSYLGHYVTANPIDKERINIAFDVRFREK